MIEQSFFFSSASLLCSVSFFADFMLNKDRHIEEVKSERNSYIPRAIVKRMKMDHLSAAGLSDAAKLLIYLSSDERGQPAAPAAAPDNHHFD